MAGQGYRHPHSDPNRYFHGHGDRHTNSNEYSYVHGYGNTYTHPHSDANSTCRW